MTMKVLQHNLNNCEAAHDLLMQTVQDWKIYVVIITDPYKPLRTNNGLRLYRKGRYLVLWETIIPG